MGKLIKLSDFFKKETWEWPEDECAFCEEKFNEGDQVYTDGAGYFHEQCAKEVFGDPLYFEPKTK